MREERSRNQNVQPPLVTSSATDEVLAQAASLSPDAFAMLYRRHASSVYRYLLARVGNVHDAQDLTTQTFIGALQSITSYQGSGKFRSWLFGIARRKVADYFRQVRTMLPLEMAEDMPDSSALLEEFLDQQLQLKEVVCALRTIAPERSEALTLRLFGQLSAAEVAQVMGKSEAAVKMLVYRAIHDLQKRLNAKPEED